MGLPMAMNLVNAGFQVQGFDINAKALARLSDAGGTACADLSIACKGAEVLILMVVNASQARQVLSVSGALDVLPVDATVCLMATCPPGEAEELALTVTSTGRRFVDCPVSGGVVGARSAALTLMAACEKSVFEFLKPVFQAIGERIYHVGEQPGQGAMCKTINQLLCGLHIAVAAEAFSLAKKTGLNLELLLDIMSGSSASSWMLKDRGSRMLRSDPEVTSAVDIFVKDLGIVSQAGRDARAALPLTAVALQMFVAASGRGEGTMDDSQVIRSFDALNGLIE